MTDPLVTYAADGAVGTITLDSPHNRNALSAALVEQLQAALAAAAADETRVVVVGSADRVFCSGADLKEAGAGGMEQGARTLADLQRTIVTHPKAVVVRLAGPVRAGGLGIVAAADLVVCADDVTFAFTESRLGLAPAVISLTVLPRLTSRAAADTFLSGRTFGAAEAAAMGLVTRAVPPEQLDAAVAQVCGDLAQAHPQGLRETKQLLARDLVARIDAQAAEMATLSARLFASDGAREAMTAFLERRRT
ncbi:enoyl-CoA hydratase family protein [Nocardioides aequoreus]|uniref:enoyl-CoA hydratase family protein n=1 Tax=Nocardioides aequoreus TaxID=397278 RepID=UPI0004C3EF53|nr:enoyl-CoA hydratase family protein [Nocardioides aequoreus]